VKAPRWLQAWWRRRRVRVAMHRIAEMSPEFRRDLGLDDTTIDDLIAHEGGGDCAAARQVGFASGKAATPGPCAPGTAP